ncbi:MAG: ABC transporter permease [Thermoguttaceae bacterium]
MKWLIWKEYRLNRLILIVGAVLLIAPHAIALYFAWRGIGPPANGVASPLAANLLISGGYSLVISQLMLAFLGGHAIACERADRSAEFLAYLPVSRARILAAKLTLPLFWAALIWTANLLILRLVIAELPLPGKRVEEQVWLMLSLTALTGLVFFSVGWLLSSMLESPTFSICGALIAPLLIVMAGIPLDWMNILHRAELWYLFTCLALAPACFIAGTWYYLRRVEP